MKNNKPEVVLVSYDSSNGIDVGILLVGKKRPNESVEIINAFQGRDANELWQKLLTVKEKE